MIKKIINAIRTLNGYIRYLKCSLIIFESLIVIFEALIIRYFNRQIISLKHSFYLSLIINLVSFFIGGYFYRNLLHCIDKETLHRYSIAE